MPRVIHFEINADKPERAAKFYTSVFGWKFDKWNGPMEYWTVNTGKGKGINGGMMKRNKKDTTVNSVGVKSVDKFITKIKKAGGKIIMPKSPIPGVGWFAYCLDTEGNSFGLMQNDKKAK